MFKTIAIACTTVLALVTAALSPAFAQDQWLFREFSPGGQFPACVGASSPTTFRNTGVSVTVKWFDGDDALVVQVHNRYWNIRARADAPMVVQFDRNRPFEVSAVGYPPSETQSGSMVQFRVGRSEAGIRFGNEIVNGNLMRIAFAAPDVPVLAVPLRGSAVALTQMRECLVRRGAFQFMGPARRTDPTVQALPDPTAPAISAASGRRT